MAKKLCLFIITAITIAASAIAANAETAAPTSSAITVDGTPMDFCAYNLYGSNYFMLRDVAAALSGTSKQFSVDWSNNTISLKSKSEYESVGTEFSQNAESTADAAFSVPKLKLNDEEITLIGYNIKDSNYFKIRDIARIFDFTVGYESGHITIDTTKSYEPEMPYDNSGVIGMAYEADLPLFINEMPVISYYTAVDTAYNVEQAERLKENPRLNGVYVKAADLESYGFDVAVYEDSVWLTRNRDKKFGIIDGEIINSAPTGVYEVYASDIKVYLDGTDTRNILINGEPYISAIELLKYGGVSKQYGEEKIYYRTLLNRINIDFMRKDLMEEFESEEGGTEKSLDDKAVIKEDLPWYEFPSVICEFSGVSLKKEKTWQYELIEDASGIHGERYIGEISAGREHGKGIKETYYIPRSGNSMEARQNWSFRRGEFSDGKLVDGVYTTQTVAYFAHYREEGAFINGYHREFVPKSGKYRFGYRTVREGTIENGEYCGYYREYDEDGKLIFEGDYADYIKQAN